MKQSVINCCDSHRYGNEVNASTSSILWQKRKQYWSRNFIYHLWKLQFRSKNCQRFTSLANVHFYCCSKSMCQPRHLFCFSSFSQHNENYSAKFDDKKRRWYAWDLNLGPQNCRCRRIHWAMEAPTNQYLFMMRQMCNGLVKTLTRYCQYNTPASYFFFDAVPITVFNLTTTY